VVVPWVSFSTTDSVPSKEGPVQPSSCSCSLAIYSEPNRKQRPRTPRDACDGRMARARIAASGVARAARRAGVNARGARPTDHDPVPATQRASILLFPFSFFLFLRGTPRRAAKNRPAFLARSWRARDLYKARASPRDALPRIRTARPIGSRTHEHDRSPAPHPLRFLGKAPKPRSQFLHARLQAPRSVQFAAGGRDTALHTHTS